MIDLAFYTDDGAALQLGAEFHHNGLGVRAAPRSAASPAAPPTPGTASGSRPRRSRCCRAHGAAVREHVITDVVPLAEGPALLADLAARRRHVIQAVLTCEE